MEARGRRKRRTGYSVRALLRHSDKHGRGRPRLGVAHISVKECGAGREMRRAVRKWITVGVSREGS